MPIAMEWSVNNLIHNRTKIVKEIIKNCLSATTSIKAEYLQKIPAQAQKVMGTTHLRVNKTYVLIEKERS